jgi:hypothetical protein
VAREQKLHRRESEEASGSSTYEEITMTATKAVAGGIAANIVTIILWGISNLPGWNSVPDQPKAAIIALVSAGVGSAIVYFAPANKQTLTSTAARQGGELAVSLGSSALLAGSRD